MLTLNRKTHVRLYALLACVGTNVVPYISRNAFLHLSNKEFTEGEEEVSEMSRYAERDELGIWYSSVC